MPYSGYSRLIIYSHRGNLSGPKSEEENSVVAVERAIKHGFHVETDIHCIRNRFFLGHDFPKHPVSLHWLRRHAHRLLLHAKNAEAVQRLARFKLHHFCHSSDKIAFTSAGFLWLHDINLVDQLTGIVPLLSRTLLETVIVPRTTIGICTDYSMQAAEMYKTSRSHNC